MFGVPERSKLKGRFAGELARKRRMGMSRQLRDGTECGYRFLPRCPSEVRRSSKHTEQADLKENGQIRGSASLRKISAQQGMRFVDRRD